MITKRLINSIVAIVGLGLLALLAVPERALATSRWSDGFGLELPAQGDVGWDDAIRTNHLIYEVTVRPILDGHCIQSGATVYDGTPGGSGLTVYWDAGTVRFAGASYTLASGVTTVSDNSIIWLSAVTTTSGGVTVDARETEYYPPSGASGYYTPLAIVTTEAGDVTRLKDLRYVPYTPYDTNQNLGTDDSPSFAGLTVGTTALVATTSGVTQTQRVATLPLKDISQGTGAGVVFKAAYNSSGTTIWGMYQNGDIFWCNSSGVIATYWDASASRLGIGTSDPDSLLEIYGINAGIKLDAPTGSGNGVGGIAFQTAGTDNARMGLYSGLHNSTRVDLELALDSGNSMFITGGSLGIGDWASLTWMATNNTQLGIISGTSPTGAPSGGAVFYAVGGQMYVGNQDGTVTAVGSFDHETGEVSFTKWNVYTGRKVVYLAESGRIIESTVPKVNPEDYARDRWVERHMEITYKVEIPKEQAFEEVDNVLTTITPRQRYVTTDGGDVVPTTVMEKGEFVQGRKKVLRRDCRLDGATGKVYRRATRAEAEAAAETGFEYDWAQLPKFVRQAWGK